jgi:hypothetical protein
VNNPCSVGIMEEGKSGEKLAIRFRIKTLNIVNEE